MKVLVLKSESGQITSDHFEEGDIGEVVRKTAEKALKEWNELTSDFIIMRDSQEAKLPLPLKPDVYEKTKNFLAGKDKTSAILKLPIFIISFENQWKEENFQDKKVYVISYYLTDELKEELTNYAAQVTSEEKAEPVEEDEEEDLEE
ncbi:DUF2286 domain-containing protein [Metallosphaera hakonensis]|uniref:DUF2286 domain-containing protein n=1 Tax=Metallosphaera hakonensis JCM 8857 = DSM 7519 TaxID=1293036 RepID=A0A2U9IUN7_9CREN|nr:DUF2286 domain-containing protein [Metallosphaera hakonensis]AWR99801.1 DUF2286 domain-containing protein [Metallosphaera hakonensis JCM 8857 = DSM 7519]